MTTAYNLANKRARAEAASREVVLDPGDGNTIIVSKVSPAICVVTGGTTRSLESAANVGLDHRVTVISQTSTITVNSVALGDGEFAEWKCTLDSSGDHQWSFVASTDAAANAVTAAAVASGADNIVTTAGTDRTVQDSGVALPASAGTYEFLDSETAADNTAGILAILAALDTAGLIDASGITQATS